MGSADVLQTCKPTACDPISLAKAQNAGARAHDIAYALMSWGRCMPGCSSILEGVEVPSTNAAYTAFDLYLAGARFWNIDLNNIEPTLLSVTYRSCLHAAASFREVRSQPHAVPSGAPIPTPPTRAEPFCQARNTYHCETSLH